MAMKTPPVQADEFFLLMTIARVLRAKIDDEIYAARDVDLRALDEALAPFEKPIGEGSEK